MFTANHKYRCSLPVGGFSMPAVVPLIIRVFQQDRHLAELGVIVVILVAINHDNHFVGVFAQLPNEVANSTPCSAFI